MDDAIWRASLVRGVEIAVCYAQMVDGVVDTLGVWRSFSALGGIQWGMFGIDGPWCFGFLRVGFVASECLWSGLVILSLL